MAIEKVDKETRRKINDLLYIEKCVSDRIHGEISEVMIGRGKTARDFGNSLKYVIDERIDCMAACEAKNEVPKMSVL